MSFVCYHGCHNRHSFFFSPAVSRWTTSRWINSEPFDQQSTSPTTSLTVNLSPAAAEVNGTHNRMMFMIDTSWFQTLFDKSFMQLPVGVEKSTSTHHGTNNSSGGANMLDDEGRATECKVVSMSLQQWIQTLHQNRHGKSILMDENETTPSITKGISSNTNIIDPVDSRASSTPDLYYLKDWHLLWWLEHHYPNELPLYETPTIFPHDMLHGFLLRFCHDDCNVKNNSKESEEVIGNDGNDYRFVYWGPAGSKTHLHSDVLNSFSWSYNVCGTKEWVFYPPQSKPHHDSSSTKSMITEQPRPVRVIQNSGELVFVPAGWKHEVTNLEETISINHNWITTANLDLVWKCIHTELLAVDHELAKWSHYDPDELSWWQARESMLHKCCGLDVSTFIFMVLTTTVDTIFTKLMSRSATSNGDELRDFDLLRLAEVLHTVLHCLDARDGGDSLHVLNRFEATLGNAEDALSALTVANRITIVVNRCIQKKDAASCKQCCDDNAAQQCY
jgi:hypothetical protein